MNAYFVLHASHILDTRFRLIVGTRNVRNQLFRIPTFLHFFTNNLNTALSIAVADGLETIHRSDSYFVVRHETTFALETGVGHRWCVTSSIGTYA